MSTRGHHLHRKARKLANGQGVTTTAMQDERGFRAELPTGAKDA